jgi:peptide deformylase
MAEVHGEVLEEDGDVAEDAEREARRRLALSQIRQYPDAALRLKAKPVETFDESLQRLVARMKILMHDAAGVGLAATQVGVVKRLFVFQLEENTDLAIVNAEIVERGDELESSDEGCLSLQGVTVPVERVLSLTLAGVDEHGEPVRLELEGHPARIVQHELDHLDGVLIIDRTTREAKREAMATLRPRILIG